MQQWEYKIQHLLAPNMNEALQTINTLGNEGWELVGSWGDNNWLFFKRPKP